MIKAVLFDLWDTLAWMPGLSELHKKLLAEMNQTGYQAMRDLFRDAHCSIISTEKFIAQVKDKTNLTPNAEMLLKQYYNVDTYELYPDTIEILRWLRSQKYKIGIISNCPGSSGNQLAQLGIEAYADCVVLSYEAGVLKPDKKIFDIALQQLHVTPEETIMIGDKEDQDMSGAFNAAIKGILLDRKNNATFQPRIRTLLELKDFLV